MNDPSTTVCDATLRDYLLARSTPGERESVEYALLVDEELAMRLEALEQELLDEHVSGRLDRRDNSDLELAYAANEHLRQRLRLARSLHALARPAVAIAKAGHRRRAMAVGAIALALAAALALLIVGRGDSRNSELRVALSPGRLRGAGGGTMICPTAAARSVRLLAQLPPDVTDVRLDAQLINSEGVVVVRIVDGEAMNGALEVVVGVPRLPDGDYRLFVATRDGTRVASYALRSAAHCHSP